MAIHNSIFLYGKVIGEPKIAINKDGTMVKALLSLDVIRNNERKTGEENSSVIIHDNPRILSQNPEIMKQISNLKENDIVYIKGVLVTKPIIKTMHCEFCHAENRVEGAVSFINPIYLKTIEQNLTQEDAFNKLKESEEVSNVATIIGSVCTEPDTYISQKGIPITTYQLAVNRKYKIKEDITGVKTDYPWVKSYKDMAQKDNEHLRKGSLVFIDGIIQTRSFSRKCQCEQCEKIFNWTDRVIEIVPYQTEYLNNFYAPGEKDKIKDAQTENFVDDLLND